MVEPGARWLRVGAIVPTCASEPDGHGGRRVSVSSCTGLRSRFFSEEAAMNEAAQPLTDDDTELSPWWLRAVVIVMVIGFAGLLAITSLAYRNAPPIPA